MGGDLAADLDWRIVLPTFVQSPNYYAGCGVPARNRRRDQAQPSCSAEPLVRDSPYAVPRRPALPWIAQKTARGCHSL